MGKIKSFLKSKAGKAVVAAAVVALITALTSEFPLVEEFVGVVCGAGGADAVGSGGEGGVP